MARLAQGLGVLRWGATREEIKQRVPQARVRGGFRGRNPATGEEFVIPEGLEVPDFVEPKPGVRVRATLEFERERLACISLATHCHAEPTDDPSLLRLTAQLVRQEAQLVADFLELGPVRADLAVQGWQLDGVEVQLYLDSDDFEFELRGEG
jgi:hypothetical protein